MSTSVHGGVRRPAARPALGLGLGLGLGRRLAGGAAGVIAAAIVAALVGLCGLMATGHRPMLEMSDSMAPVMRAGDVLFVKRITAAQARPGDIVTFSDPERDGQTITHRVVSVEPKPSGGLGFVTRGDANTGVERWRARADASIGRYAFRIPSAGRLVDRTRSPPWRAMVALAGVLLTLDLLCRLWRTPTSPR
jgi:signal peptidase